MKHHVREFVYTVSGVSNTMAYANALNVVSRQLGKDPYHTYRQDRDSGLGVILFATPVELDVLPLQEAGLIVEKQERTL